MTARPICKICGDAGTEPLGIDSFLFETISFLPDFHEFENYLCPTCGVAFIHPQIPPEKLAEFYESGYWQTLNDEGLIYNGQRIEAPLDFTNSRASLQRAKSFFLAVDRAAERIPEVVPKAGDLVIDYGAYQGLFLHALRARWGIEGLPFDYNRDGLRFAEHILGFEQARVTEEIYADRFEQPARFVTMVHLFEHLHDPMRLLTHIRENALAPDGFLYIEVPNLLGHPASDPFHFFTFSERSMRQVMARAGFEVVELFTNSWPPKPHYVGANDIQNLVCLARPKEGLVPPPSLPPEQIRREIRKSYAQLSGQSVARLGRSALRDGARALYYFLFSVLLERLSPGLMMRIARALGFRRRPPIDP